MALRTSVARSEVTGRPCTGSPTPSTSLLLAASGTGSLPARGGRTAQADQGSGVSADGPGRASGAPTMPTVEPRGAFAMEADDMVSSLIRSPARSLAEVWFSTGCRTLSRDM